MLVVLNEVTLYFHTVFHKHLCSNHCTISTIYTAAFYILYLYRSTNIVRVLSHHKGTGKGTPTPQPFLTKLVSQDESSSFSDLTKVTPHLSLRSVWNPVTTLNSDHLLIIIKLADWFPDPHTDVSRTYTNIRKTRTLDYMSEPE